MGSNKSVPHCGILNGMRLMFYTIFTPDNLPVNSHIRALKGYIITSIVEYTLPTESTKTLLNSNDSYV